MLYLRPLRLTGWKLLAVALVGLLVLVLATWVLVLLGLALGVLLAVVLLHVLVLPRLSRRLGLSTPVLGALLLPLLLGLALAVTGSLQSLLVALGIWLVGIALPQLALYRLRRRLAWQWSSAPRAEPIVLLPGMRQERVLEAVRCERCGWTVWTEASSPGRCPQCGHPISETS